jgi:hypothetical protein
MTASSRFGLRLACLVTASGLVAGLTPAWANDSSFTVKVDVPPAKHGERAVVKVHVVPGKGYHMNLEFPTALSMAATDGVTVEKTKQTGKEAARLVEAGLDFDVALTASAAGNKVMNGDLKFAVCSATSCDPKREKVSFTVEAK